MKKNILFVDDEPNVLQGLKRMLRNMRKEWNMAYANSGQEALSIMEQETFDVIVSDMRMPGMDGAQLLTEVMKRYPNTVRIVLSGQSEKEAIFRAIGKTHQYLAKPCNADVLRQTVSRACALRDLLSNDSLKSLASEMEQMPSMPEIYIELVEELKSDNPSLPFISRLISQDVAMTAKILQLVNSAFFGIRRRITTVDMAVNYLGLENVSSLVLAANIFSQFQKAKRIKGFSMESLWGHSGQVGRYAQTIMKEENQDKSDIDDALTAGLLHDCGRLILVSNRATEYEATLKKSADENIPLIDAERDTFGATHAEIGAYLLGVWGLPDTIVEAVAFHHTPSMCPSVIPTPLTAVHVANVITNAETNEHRGGQLDMAYLNEINVANRLEHWKSVLSKK